MNTQFTLKGAGVFATVLLAVLTAFPASARGVGFGAGGGHVAAFRGGVRGAYGWHGGFGFRGGWRGYGFYPGWGWGWGALGYGLFFGALPFYYSTLWWNGVPYYYASGDYYRWNAVVGEYETVPAPPGLQSQVDGQQPGTADLFVYPKNGQSAEQQARDKYECHSWAKDQTGFDPTLPGGTSTAGRAPPAAEWAAKRQDYTRAQTACLEGRGYSVR